LWLQTCDCGHFQKNGIPYGHVFTLIHALQVRMSSHSQPRDYMPYYFTTRAWQYTYQQNLKAISLERIKASTISEGMAESIVGPKTERKTMGRPKVKRMVAGESKRRIAKAQAILNNSEIVPVQGSGSQSCSYCGEYGVSWDNRYVGYHEIMWVSQVLWDNAEYVGYHGMWDI